MIPKYLCISGPLPHLESCYYITDIGKQVTHSFKQLFVIFARHNLYTLDTEIRQ